MIASARESILAGENTVIASMTRICSTNYRRRWCSRSPSTGPDASCHDPQRRGGSRRRDLVVEGRLPAALGAAAVHQAGERRAHPIVLGGTLEGLSADVMWESSGGNPLFLRHMVEGALESEPWP